MKNYRLLYEDDCVLLLGLLKKYLYRKIKPFKVMLKPAYDLNMIPYFIPHLASAGCHDYRHTKFCFCNDKTKALMKLGRSK